MWISNSILRLDLRRAQNKKRLSFDFSEISRRKACGYYNITSADNLCKQFGPRSGLTFCRSDLEPNYLTDGIPGSFFFKSFLKNLQTIIKKLPSMQSVIVTLTEICEDPIDLDANSYNIFPESLDSTELAYQSLQNSFGMYIGPKGEDVALSYSIKNYEGMPVLMEFIFRSRNAKKAALKIFNDGQLVEEWVSRINIPQTLWHHMLFYPVHFEIVWGIALLTCLPH